MEGKGVLPELVVAEVAEALARYGGLACHVTVDVDDLHGDVYVKVLVRPTTDPQVASAGSLADDLQYLVDVATMHALAKRYGIRQELLEPFLKERT